MLKEFLWTEKYRPKTVKDTILPKTLKAKFQGYVDEKNSPNLLLIGKGGVGKTSVAKALLEELDCSYLVINGSLEGRTIDVLRTMLTDFASSLSFKKKRKYVIIDEADYLGINNVQPALRNFLETFSNNCGFILTCNYPNRIMPELRSRTSEILFEFPKAEYKDLITQFYKRAVQILEAEKVAYDKKVLVTLIDKHYPDFRRVLNELQGYAATGKIDTGILSSFSQESFDGLLKNMKAKSFTEVRKWAAENSDIESHVMFRSFFDSASKVFVPKAIPELVLILNEHQDKATRVADPEINIVAFLVTVMLNCEFA